MFSWFGLDNRRRKIREDRKYLEARARRFLKSYLAAEGAMKHRYYEAVEEASAACHPRITNITLEDAHFAEATAEAALKVVKRRGQRASDSHDNLATLITDSYATVAVAYRRAAGVYAIDEEMQKLGTAARASSYDGNFTHEGSSRRKRELRFQTAMVLGLQTAMVLGHHRCASPYV